MTDEETLRQTFERAKLLTYKNEKELDDIRKKGKMALENLFPSKFYWIEIGDIKFSQVHNMQVSEAIWRKEWEDGKNELINLLDTALLDLKSKKEKLALKPTQEKIVSVVDDLAIRAIEKEFTDFKRNVTNWILYAILTIIISLFFWIMFLYSDWEWYNGHQKKLGLTLMFNLTVIVGLLNIPIRQKWTIWIPTVIAVLATIFTLI